MQRVYVAYMEKTITLPSCHRHEFLDAGLPVSKMLTLSKIDTVFNIDIWMDKLVILRRARRLLPLGRGSSLKVCL